MAYFHNLYLANFPECERREWSSVIRLMSTDARFHVTIADHDGLDVGFISYWTLDGFNYIEHLAVEGRWRRMGYGASLVRHVASLGAPLLLEVEPPVDDVTVNRVKFYQRLGLTLREDVEYVQPPYGPGMPPVPLRLMTSSSMTHDDVERAVATIKAVVYRQAIP